MKTKVTLNPNPMKTRVTPNEENRLKQKLEMKVQVEKSKLDSLTANINKLQTKYKKLRASLKNMIS